MQREGFRESFGAFYSVLYRHQPDRPTREGLARRHQRAGRCFPSPVELVSWRDPAALIAGHFFAAERVAADRLVVPVPDKMIMRADSNEKEADYRLIPRLPTSIVGGCLRVNDSQDDHCGGRW